ncbi:MAG: radical SAM protein [Methanothrix soehngenii]
MRFLTSHPNYMTDRILEAVRDLPKVCPHIEVPIQAGDDDVLERMKRGYTSAEYRALIARIRAIVPEVAIHTDIIVGFCGETDEQFERTVEIVREVKFDKVHLARYSPRPGTVSERRMDDDVPEAEKVRRHKAPGSAARAGQQRDQRPQPGRDRRSAGRGSAQGQMARAQPPEQARLHRKRPAAARAAGRGADHLDGAVVDAGALCARCVAAARQDRAASTNLYHRPESCVTYISNLQF